MAVQKPSLRQFQSTLDMDLRGMHTSDYLAASLFRQYRALHMTLDAVRPGDRVLSIGAGGAFVEEYLARHCRAEVHIVDFGEAITMNSPLYDRYFAAAHAGNVCAPGWSSPVADLDAVLWFDNIEHVAIDPTAILRKLRPALKPRGKLIVTTDNFARLRNIVKLACGRSIVAGPDLLFSADNFGNEGVHRREYTFAELKDVLRRSGYDIQKVEYLWQNRREPACKSPFIAVEYLIPSVRPHMLVQAELGAAS